MSESTSTTQSEPTVAEKRQYLKDHGVAVGTRGKLSADQEARYAELTQGNGQA